MLCLFGVDEGGRSIDFALDVVVGGMVKRRCFLASSSSLLLLSLSLRLSSSGKRSGLVDALGLGEAKGAAGLRLPFGFPREPLLNVDCGSRAKKRETSLFFIAAKFQNTLF